MRVRISAFTNGFVYPCASPENTQLFEGPIEPNQAARVATPAACVCIDHTFDDFPDSDWSTAQTFCRQLWMCAGRGSARHC
jgi:hypothetical protein